MKVGIFAGHGLMSNGVWDCGCTYKSYNEADLALLVTRSFVKYMRSSDVVVYTDETGGNMKNMNATIGVANRNHLKVYISIHLDYSKAPSGTLPICNADSVEGKKLAMCLNEAVTKNMKIGTRGIRLSRDLGEVVYTDMPACIFELGSIKADLRIIRDHYDDYGKALAKGLCKYLGVEFKEPSFKVSCKADLVVREGYSLKSKKMAKKCYKGHSYTIVETKGSRGKLKTGGWITITDKYVKR